MLNYIVNKFSDKFTVTNIFDLFSSRVTGTSKVYDFLAAKGADKQLIQRFFKRLQQKNVTAAGSTQPLLWAQLSKELANHPQMIRINNELERGSVEANRATEALIKTLQIEVHYKNGHIKLMVGSNPMPLIDMS